MCTGMEEAKPVSVGPKNSTKSKFKLLKDEKRPKKRKAPRYWSNDEENKKHFQEKEEKGDKEGVEEITIDPVVLGKYTRGERIKLKVYLIYSIFCSANLSLGVSVL